MKKLAIFLFLSIFTFKVFSQCIVFETIDILEYDINLDISDIESESISGFTSLTINPIVNGVNTINLDLLKLNIDSITGQKVDIIDFEYNDTLIIISLENSVNINDTLIITVYYHGQPVQDPSGWGGFYFDNGYAFNLGVGFEDQPHNYGRVWFPCRDNFKDRARYKFNITTDIDHMAVCGGELVYSSIDEENNKAFYSWELNDPIPTYLASVAVGKFDLYDTVYHGINGEIPVEIYTLPNQTQNARNSFQNVNEVLSIFEDKFGPYRWNRVGFVCVPFVFGAMEHATNVTISSAFVDGTLNYEDLLYHEIAHSWFGNLVTCENSGDMWLNEGWAKYSESIYREFLYGRENMLSFRRNAHNTVLRYYHIQDGGFHPIYGVPKELTYSRTVYEKGASVAHSMRGYLGDSIFFDAIKAYMDEFEFNHVNSYDFRDFLNNHTQIDMTDFFDTHVFRGGFVHYSIDSTNIEQSGNDYIVTVYMRQRLRGADYFANSNRIEVSFLDSEFNEVTKMFEFDGEFGENTFTIPFFPEMIFCDYHERFSDATIDEAKFITSTGNADYSNMYFRANVNEVNEEKPALLRITHNWVAPDPFIEDIPGLIIANHRFWTVEGNFPEGFSTGATFYYRNNVTGAGMLGHLDNDFITNSADSIRLVYRPDRATDWTILDNVSHSIGLRTLRIDNLMPGEYSLAIYDWAEYMNNPLLNKSNENIKIYPNPTQDILNIDFKTDFSGEIIIYNIAGQSVLSKKYPNNINNLSLNVAGLDCGLYIIRFYDGKSFKNKRIVINR